MKTPSLLIFLFILTLGRLFAQNQNQPQGQEDGNYAGIAGFWEVVTSDGRFVARLDQIASVSQHQYLIDGGIRVYEVTVDTDGAQTARFYYIESVNESSSVTTGSATFNRIKDLANQATEKAGMGNLDSIVTKHYPDTTHAKTSEYRMSNKATIDQIYNHVHRVWAVEKGRGKQNRLVIRNG
jgi:hypothetical protein